MNHSEEFNDLVNNDIRTGTVVAPGAEILRNLDNVHDWLDALLIIKIEAEFQLSAAKLRLETQSLKYDIGQIDDDEWVSTLEKHNSWKNGALRIKAGVEVRIVEARSIIRDDEMYEPEGASIDEEYWPELTLVENEDNNE